MIGKRFGRLVVTKLSPNTSGKRKRLMYYCDCDCGKKNVEIIGEKLRSGHTRSCGCLRSETASNLKKKFNNYEFKDYGIGITSNTNKEFYFDLEDYDKIKDYCWAESKNNYIVATNKDYKLIYMHRLIMDITDNKDIDHKNHNKNDNRKSNLRVCNRSNNAMNANMRSDNTSGATGVSFNKRDNTWCASIQLNGEKITLGYFSDIKDAIKARHEAEEMYFKEWSYKNSTGKYNNEKENLNG